MTSYLRHPHLVVVMVVVVMALTTTLSAGFVLTTGRMAHLEVLGSLLTLLSRILLSSAMATWIALKRLEPRSILETRFVLETTFILALSSTLAPRFIRNHIRNGTPCALACRGIFGLVSNSLFLTMGADPESPLQLHLVWRSALWTNTVELGFVLRIGFLEGSATVTLVHPEGKVTHGEG